MMARRLGHFGAKFDSCDVTHVQISTIDDWRSKVQFWRSFFTTLLLACCWLMLDWLQTMTPNRLNVQQMGFEFSVTRFGENSPLWHVLIKLWPFLKGSFTIWQNFEHTLTNFIWFWANVQCLVWFSVTNKLAIWSHWFGSIDPSVA